MNANAMIAVNLPWAVTPQQMDGQRFVYFETSREGVADREGEDIAANALWASKDSFVASGNLDINHFSWLGNPYGSGMRPEYVIGNPADVKRRGPSIFVKGSIYSNLTPPPDQSNGYWADWFWHSIAEMNPAMKWFPSVFGAFAKSSVVTTRRGNEIVRVINRTEWTSVGFAQRAQHPALGPVSTEIMEPFAKAEGGNTLWTPDLNQPLILDWATFVKATGEGIATATPYTTDSALKTNFAATQGENLQGARQPGANVRILNMVLKGKVNADVKSIARAFKRITGCDDTSAHARAEKLLTRIAKTRD